MHTCPYEDTSVSSNATISSRPQRFRARTGLWVLAAVAAVACAAAATMPAQAQAQERGFRWGGAVGLRAGLPLGADVSTEGASDDEFVPGLSLQLELFSVQLGDSLQVSPVVDVGFSGGLSEEQYRDALLGEDGDVNDVSSARASAGLLLRWMPFAPGGVFRPYLIGGMSYLRSGVTYTEPASFSVPGGNSMDAAEPPTGSADEGPEAGDPGMESEGMPGGDESGVATGGFPFGAPSSVFRHTGVGVEAGLGVRLELPAPWFGEDGILPISLEMSYRQGLWLKLEQDGSASDLALLAPEGMSMNMLSLTLSAGYLR